MKSSSQNSAPRSLQNHAYFYNILLYLFTNISALESDALLTGVRYFEFS